jgi:hypothetical protein
MKVCPVCNEEFANELRFCEFDGAKLNRVRGDSDASDQNRLWSLLGIALVVVAVVISATTIFLLPKTTMSPMVDQPTASQQTTAVSTPPPGEPVADSSSKAPEKSEPEVVVASVPDPPKKESPPLAETPADARKSALNPKAAATASDNGEKSASSTAQPRFESTPAAIDPDPTPARSTRETRADSIAKPTTGSAAPEARKDDKHQTGAANDKDSAKKKPDEKEKKKGGFLKVFKKIFGKN